MCSNTGTTSCRGSCRGGDVLAQGGHLAQCLPGLGVADHVDPLLDDGGLTVVHPCREHVLLGDVHLHWLLHHLSDAVHLWNQPLVLLVPRVEVGR